MTALAIQIKSFSWKTLTKAVSSYFVKAGKAIIIARQIQANRKLAEMLVHEYRDEHDVQSLWQKLNEDTIEGWGKKQ